MVHYCGVLCLFEVSFPIKHGSIIKNGVKCQWKKTGSVRLQPAEIRVWPMHDRKRFWKCRTWLKFRRTPISGSWMKAWRKYLTIFLRFQITVDIWVWNLLTSSFAKTMSSILLKNVRRETPLTQPLSRLRSVWSIRRRTRLPSMRSLWAICL